MTLRNAVRLLLVAKASFLLGLPAHAEDPFTPPDIAAYFRLSPGAPAAPASARDRTDSIETYAVGDLTGRHTLDWAGMARHDDDDAVADADADADDRNALRLYVFLEGPDATHRPVARSEPLSTQCGTSRCWIEGLGIARQSVYVTWATSWHQCFDRSTSQFKSIGGRWRLVGVRRESREDPDGDDDHTPSREVIVDRNALTGETTVTISTYRKPRIVRHLKIDAPARWLEEYSLDLEFGVPHSRAIPVTCGRE